MFIKRTEAISKGGLTHACKILTEVVYRRMEEQIVGEIGEELGQGKQR